MLIFVGIVCYRYLKQAALFLNPEIGVCQLAISVQSHLTVAPCFHMLGYLFSVSVLPLCFP